MNKLTKKERAWIMYDCGNSAYSMAITTALFPALMGMLVAEPTQILGFFNSFASLLVAVLAPILGTIADYKDTKKRFFAFFALLGIAFSALLAAVPNAQWQLMLGIYVVTAVGFAGSNIFYDSFLVDTTSRDRFDSVSAKGFAYGYIASVIPFGISLGVVYMMGMSNPLGFKLSFIITALWWGLFTIPMFRHIKQIHYVEKEPKPVAMSFRRLAKTFKNIRNYKVVFGFLIAYFLYIDGVDTIIKMAVPFATMTMGLDANNTFLLLGILLVIQIIAFPCALLYGRLAKKHGARPMIIVGIITYIIACIFAFFMTVVWHVFILGALIGSAQGGIQALSRSYYAKIIPKNNSNEFFGFYNIFGKFAAILGPLLMGLAVTVGLKSGLSSVLSNKISIFAVVPLFILGLIVFLRMPKDKDLTEAEEVVL
ncbi:MAG: MFS transporter [Eubacteriales bacterium]